MYEHISRRLRERYVDLTAHELATSRFWTTALLQWASGVAVSAMRIENAHAQHRRVAEKGM